jgi:hypothetical protein
MIRPAALLVLLSSVVAACGVGGGAVPDDERPSGTAATEEADRTAEAETGAAPGPNQPALRRLPGVTTAQ